MSGCESSAGVMMSSQLQPAERAAIEMQLSELPLGRLEGGTSGDICHFDWPLSEHRSSCDRRGNWNLQVPLLHTDRDFRPEDYQTVIDLDEQAESSQNEESEISLSLSQMPVTRVAGEGDSNNFECSICLENMKMDEDIRTLPCMHVFHRACIDAWLRKPGVAMTCPIDQQIIDMQGETVDEES
jgi:hypothetical protein